MKNKNIKNKPKTCGRWLFLHSRFSKIFRRRIPLIKGIHQLNPKCLSSTTTASKGKKESESLPPLKQSTRDLSLGYTEIEKRRRAPRQDLFVLFVIGLFETLICVLQQKIQSVIAALSFRQHCLSFYFVCDDQIQISCAA